MLVIFHGELWTVVDQISVILGNREFIHVLNSTNVSSKGVRGVSYWKGWIDGVLNLAGGIGG